MQELILGLMFLVAALIAIGLALTLVFAGTKAASGPLLGAAAILGLYVLEAWLLALPPVSLGLLVYPQDLVFGGLFLFGAVRTASHPQRTALQHLLLFIFLLDLALFAIGTVKYGTLAGVELRQFFYVTAGSIYFASFKYDEATLRGMEKLVIAAVSCLLLLAAYRWSSDILHFGRVNWGQTVGARALRVLNSSHALFLLCSLFFLGYGLDVGIGRWRSVLLATIFLAVLILQHRTVWVSLLAGAALLAYLRPRYFRWAGSPIFLFLVLPAMIGVAGAAILASQQLSDSLLLSISEVFQTKRSTLTWRISGWQELLASWAHGGPLVNAFGFPFGTGWRHFVTDIGQFTDYSPHSFYVQLLLRGGLVKLGLFGALFWVSISSLVRSTRQQGGTPTRYPFVATMVLATATYLITYGTDYFMGLVFGIAFSLAGEKRVVERVDPLANRQLA